MKPNPPLKRAITQALLISTVFFAGAAFYLAATGHPYWCILFGVYLGFNMRALVHEFYFVPRQPLPKTTPAPPPTTIHI